MPLCQRVIVIISTALFHGEASRRKSNCWLLRRVGPEQLSELGFLALVVITGAVYEVLFPKAVDITGVE